MITRLAVAGLLCSILLAPAAMAQAANPQGNPPAGSATPPAAAPQAGTGSAQFITRRDANILRASDLIGQDVFSAQNEDIGEVEDVLIDRNGRVVAIVIEAGGFLGLGERQIAVPPQAVQMQPHEMTATTGTVPNAGLPPSTATGAQQRTDNRISHAVVPDRIMLTIPVEQLRAAPAYTDDD